jgi:uncharacterized membrane protein
MRTESISAQPESAQGRMGKGLNVGKVERAVSVAAGGALAAVGLRKRGVTGMALALVGAALARRGVTGHCEVYGALGVSTRSTGDVRDRDDVTGRAATVNARKAIKVERSIQVQRPAEELYDLWRDFSNLPRFMRYLDSVHCSDALHSHWVAHLPGGKDVKWDSEIVNDIPGQLIAWKTIGHPDVSHAGSVHFTPRGGDTTEVRIVFDYEPPFARTMGTIASRLGLTPDSMIDGDLQRFREYAETMPHRPSSSAGN